MYLCRGGVSEYIEGTEAAISGLEWVLTYPPTIDIVVEVRLRADSLIHIGEVDGGDFSLSQPAVRWQCRLLLGLGELLARG